MTHKERILANLQSLSNLTDTAIAKVDNNLYVVGARKMLDTLGGKAYDVYVELQKDPAVTAEIEDENYSFENSTASARKLKDLELSEAYFVLYFLSLALKRIDIDVFMTDMEQWGEGKIDPVDINRILMFGDRYLQEGRVLALPHSSVPDEDDDGESGIVLGTMGAFVI